MSAARSTAARVGVVATAVAAVIALVPSAGVASDVVPIHDRTYTASIFSIKAVDETGYDWMGSDEVYGGFRLQYSNGYRSEVQTRRFEMDAGRTAQVPGAERCIGMATPIVNNGQSFLSPQQGDSWGCYGSFLKAPFTLEGALFEDDDDLPITPCGFPCTFNPVGPGVLSPLEGDDDGIGYRHVSFSAAGLANDLITPTASKDYTFDFKGSGAHYKVTYRVSRTS